MKMLSSHRVRMVLQVMLAVGVFAFAGCLGCGCGR
jgi:hypothetical protein